ncbi:hypothetical protein BB552_28940, partial [Escherichia coli]
MSGAITAFEQYQRFIKNEAFNNSYGQIYHPYGTSFAVANWSGNGLTTNNVGYQGELTGGNINVVPQAYGVYS